MKYLITVKSPLHCKHDFTMRSKEETEEHLNKMQIKLTELAPEKSQLVDFKMEDEPVSEDNPHGELSRLVGYFEVES